MRRNGIPLDRSLRLHRWGDQAWGIIQSAADPLAHAKDDVGIPQLLVSPFRPDVYPFAFSMGLRLDARRGSLAAAIEVLCGLGVDILEGDLLARGHHHFTWEAFAYHEFLFRDAAARVLNARDPAGRAQLADELAKELDDELHTVQAALIEANEEHRFLHASLSGLQASAFSRLHRLWHSWRHQVGHPIEFAVLRRRRRLHAVHRDAFQRQLSEALGLVRGFAAPCVQYEIEDERLLLIDLDPQQKRLTSDVETEYLDAQDRLRQLKLDWSAEVDESDPPRKERTHDLQPQGRPPSTRPRNARGRAPEVFVHFKDEKYFGDGCDYILEHRPDVKFHLWGNETISVTSDVVSELKAAGILFDVRDRPGQSSSRSR